VVVPGTVHARGLLSPGAKPRCAECRVLARANAVSMPWKMSMVERPVAAGRYGRRRQKEPPQVEGAGRSDERTRKIWRILRKARLIVRQARSMVETARRVVQNNVRGRVGVNVAASWL